MSWFERELAQLCTASRHDTDAFRSQQITHSLQLDCLVGVQNWQHVRSAEHLQYRLTVSNLCLASRIAIQTTSPTRTTQHEVHKGDLDIHAQGRPVRQHRDALVGLRSARAMHYTTCSWQATTSSKTLPNDSGAP